MYTINKLRIFALTVLMVVGFGMKETTLAQPGARISFETFYQELSPYGRWTSTPQYGSVWTPYVSSNFQPYSTNGYWEMTEYGNTWVSNYDWGWAPFHYGRWSFDDYLGWFWVPGYDWGPAWVNWRSGGGYYGWAPLGPGIGINVSINIPSFWWIFVPNRHFYTSNWHNYWVPRNRIGGIYNRTTIINNYYRNDNRSYVYGPRREEIERTSRRSVPVREIDMNQRGRVITNSDRNSRSNYNSGDYNSSRSNGARTSQAPETDNRSNSRVAAPERYERSPSSRPESDYSTQRGNTNNIPQRNESSRESSPARTAPSNSRVETPSVENSRSSRQSSEGTVQRSSREQAPTVNRSSRSTTPTVRSAPSTRSSGTATRSSSSRSERSSSSRSSRSND